MQIKLYQIIIFICVIVTATVIIFPSQHFIAQELINSGRLETARYYINRYTSKNPDDAILFIMSSNTYLLEGMPEKAIDELKPFLNHKKVSKNILIRLAQLYEWERDPKHALRTLERTIELFPNDTNILDRLINYYRYYGKTEKEMQSITALAKLNYKKKNRDVILTAIDQKMVNIANEHVKNPDPMFMYLLSQLHIARKNYEDDISDPSITVKKKKELDVYTINRIIELYVYADLFDDAKLFVQQLDNRLKSGITYRIALMTVLRWADLDDLAIDYLWNLQKQAPGYNEILDHIVKISMENGQTDIAITALNSLLQADPTNEIYANKMAQLYIQSENYDKAYDLYEKLAIQFPGKEYDELIVNTALQSDQQSLAWKAIQKVDGISDKQPGLLNQLVDIFLFLDRPNKAFDYHIQYIKTQIPPNRDDIKKMLDIAVWSNEKKNMDQSVFLIQQYFPEDPELIHQSGDAYLAMENSEKAFKLYGSLIHLMTENRDFLIKYMETATYTQSKDIMVSAALTVSKLRSNDYKIINKCVQLFQWSNQMIPAYTLYEQWFNQYGSTAEHTQQLLKLSQETGNSEIVKKAVHLSKRSMPKDPDIMMAIAEQSIASGLITEAIYALEAYNQQRKKDFSAKRRLAELYVWSGQNEAAFQMYQQLHEQFPNDSLIRDKMLEIASWTKNSNATAYLVSEIADASPSVYTLQIKAGNAWVAAGQTEKSIPFFERALSSKPDNPNLLRKLSQYYSWIEQYDDSIRILETIAQYDSLALTERIQLAQFYMDQKQPQKVITQLGNLSDKELQESSGILLAIAYEQTGQKNKAIAIYRMLAQKYPDNPEILVQMGNQLLWMKQFNTALSFYEQALSVDSKQLEALKGSAQIYSGNNNLNKAIHYLKRYIQLNPYDYKIQYQLGELLYARGEKNYAFKHYQKALALINRAKKNANKNQIQ